MVMRTLLLVALSLMLGACASEPAAPAADDAATTAPAPAPDLPRASQSRLIAPVRGEAVLDITKPDTQVVRGEIVTTMTVRNASTEGAIAGLRVEENWYNKAGDPVGGDTYRHAAPLRSGEVVVVTLTTPRSPAMNSNRYQFTHANGTIKTNIVDEIEVPEPEDEPEEDPEEGR